MSLADVHASETRIGWTAVRVSTGAGLGGVVSAGVETVTALLLAERFPFASMA
ncbi:hypothetical protein ACFQV2_11850 [Actinokineospora soli]|uniref:Uncharacterized protein n=1 Tax=Actinokineospora soli TaxID=1048753 RepID=A0ABW2TLL4_9PSEU